jgi:NAD(P)-dependent dehydrogenase (short-subunit alcohol dehydrogenase family)
MAHLFGVVNLTKAAIPVMRRQGAGRLRPPDQNANTEGRGRSTTANHTNQVVLIYSWRQRNRQSHGDEAGRKGRHGRITCRREATGAAAVKEIERVARDGAQVRFIRNDLTDESAVKGLIDGIVSEFGHRTGRQTTSG